MIEIEKRGLLTEEKYLEVKAFLHNNAEDLGEDDKDVLYYIYDDKLMKIVNNLSHGNAKISLKMNKLGDGIATKEIEVSFDSKKFSDMEEIVNVIASPKQVIKGLQKRHNFLYEECEIAMKWSKDYGYHFEIEIITDKEEEVEILEKKIDITGQKLGITFMSNEEIREFQRNVEQQAKSDK